MAISLGRKFHRICRFFDRQAKEVSKFYKLGCLLVVCCQRFDRII